ncbi:MAG: S1/P1 nuclease [Bacteroidales bacterium]|nr:S1/P1 nuclease [Bacteroidales bacterium]
MNRILASISGCLLLMLVPASAWAWSAGGHMVTGAIAYDLLKQDDPATLREVLALLRANPLYDRMWKERLADIPADEQDVYLFMLAARWADDIRNNRDYDHPTWHYIGTGFVAPGEPASVKLPKVAVPNALTELSRNARLARTAPDIVDRAVAALWVFHLVGDIHQPLHACSRVTAQMPEGDRGGNRFYIRVKPGNRPISLHKYWDDLLVGSARFRDVRNRATALRLRPEFARDKLTELADSDPETWARESLDLAVRVAHQNGRLRGGMGELSAELLPADYATTAKVVAERRAVLAGYRLAHLLRSGIRPPR